MSRRTLLLILLLGAGVLASSVAVVYAKYSSRRHFVELQGLRARQDALEVEWSRLQLEQGAWSTNGRVERIARDRLKMHIPSADEVVVIRP
ncbi:MAG TPA: cell division protein FtsL [Sedimenticola thiotaurini]|uniref:Cell division protein FtsL n=1 Tax=Sedimenticola thiotaurini TaxID=1543721 RepID=A0A831RLZ7_9GAMM|nr:cell division protein FtsL [Sedimenticola thiotaurini]